MSADVAAPVVAPVVTTRPETTADDELNSDILRFRKKAEEPRRNRRRRLRYLQHPAETAEVRITGEDLVTAEPGEGH